MSETQEPLNLFISYAHEDASLCLRLVKHLSQLRREGVDGWYDRKITAGTEWEGEIDEHLNSADIILLLISPDFLASRYCYDLEMQRALELHEQKRARVVPVILRPCDWAHSPFSKLNALPRDGKPVVDWKTRDHGFLNVVEGLRVVVAELRARKRVPTESTGIAKPEFRQFTEVPSRRWAYLCAAAVLLLAAGWFWWGQQQRYIAEGEASLDVGRYAAARAPFEVALRWNPMSGRAAHGLATAKLYELRSKPVEFEQRLKELLKDAPDDAHLKILEGDFELAQDRRDQAMADYQKASAMNPRVAEAYYRMCVLYGMLRNPGRALAMCRQAVGHARLAPHYRANLAAQYFKHGEYQQAIREYSQVVDGYPLAKLELAKLLRLQGELDAAREKGQLAVEELMNGEVMASLPENMLPWTFEVSREEGVSIPSKDQKLCYAYLELSATRYLMGDESHAIEDSKRAVKACGSQTSDVKAVVELELMRVAGERSELAPRVEAFSSGVLAGWGTMGR